jgi:hypothetical protein
MSFYVQSAQAAAVRHRVDCVMKTDPSANPKVRPEVAATLSARIDAETSRGSAYCAFKRDRERLLPWCRATFGLS